MTRELEAEALYYENKRSSSRTLGCFAGCSTFFVPFAFTTFGASTPVVMVITVAIGIIFMIRGLNARAKRDEIYRKLGAEKTHNGWHVAPTPQAYGGDPNNGWGNAPHSQVAGSLPPVNGLPPADQVDPWSLPTSSAAGTTPGAAKTPASPTTSPAEASFADDDKLSERLKKAKKAGL
jgi:hypothetical protein